jgi:hypothetical protein
MLYSNVLLFCMHRPLRRRTPLFNIWPLPDKDPKVSHRQRLLLNQKNRKSPKTIGIRLVGFSHSRTKLRKQNPVTTLPTPRKSVMSAPEVLPPVDGLAQAPVDKPAPPPMSVAPYKPPLPATNANASLYVGELDPTVTEAILFEIFNMIGPVARYMLCLRSSSLAC